MPTVLIIQAQIKQYRVPFFDKLHAVLARDGITLQVAYGEPPPSEVKKGDNRDLPAEYGIKVKSSWVLGERVIYQPLLRRALAADLVVVEQANKYVLTHFLLPLSALGLKRLAYWGLAENKQTNRSAFSEWYKRQTLRRVNWWFAYTEGTARYLADHGVPPNMITAVHNAVDTGDIRKISRRLAPTELSEARQKLRIGPQDPVGTYCGMLDPVKGLDFLVESARLIRRDLDRFHLIIIGGGPQKDALMRSVAAEPWIHCVGPQFGRDKLLLLKLSDALLAPGRVGLVILDAFAVGLPLLTTELPIHGPEIEYLKDGYNGIMTEHDTGKYADAVRDLLRDRARLQVLQAGAVSSGAIYTIENMVNRFSQGIHSCLDASRNHLTQVNS